VIDETGLILLEKLEALPKMKTVAAGGRETTALTRPYGNPGCDYESE